MLIRIKLKVKTILLILRYLVYFMQLVLCLNYVKLGNLEQWDVSEVTNMSFLLRGASSSHGNLERWDVSKVTGMSGMFRDAPSFQGNLE